MKLVIILADGDGRLHVETARAPEIVRRDISKQTGRGEIIFCAMPVYGMSPAGLAADLRKRIADCDLDNSDRARILKIALFEIFVRPYAKHIWRRTGRIVRGATGVIAVKRLLGRSLACPNGTATGGNHE